MLGAFAIPRVALLLAGFAAGSLTRLLKAKSVNEGHVASLKRSVADLEARLANHEGLVDVRVGKLEARVEEHAQKLKEVPSTSQIVAAMEELLSKTMASLDQRLSSQAHSIEVLKTTVSQTDELLERVLESIDSLRQPNQDEEAEFASAGSYAVPEKR